MKNIFAKHISWIVALAIILCSVFSVVSGIELKAIAEESIYWDGTTAPPVDLGDGKYEISTPEQLAYVIDNGGGEGNTYILANDIYLNDVAKINWQTGTVNVEYDIKSWFSKKKTNLFNGTLDGNGYVVYGLYYNDTDGQEAVEWDPNAVGLVPYMGKGVVKNIGVDYAYIYNNEQYATAAIIGCGHNKIEATIEQCFVGKNATISSIDAAGIIGGGKAAGTVTIKNCYSLATLKATGYAGGIIGDSWQPENWIMENCFTVGKATGSTWKPATHNNVYETIKNKGVLVGVENIKGETAKEALVGFDFDSIWKTTEGHPMLRVFDHSASESISHWDGTTASPVDLGDGKYEISTPEQLAFVIDNGGGEGNTYTLTNDIYLNDVAKINWQTGVGNVGYTVKHWFSKKKVNLFNGILDGNGYVVYGLYYMDTDGEAPVEWDPRAVGLVPYMGKGSVKNIGVDYAYIYNNEQYATAAIIGCGHNTIEATIEQCFVGERVKVLGRDVAGIIGGGKALGAVTIKNCYSLATLDATGYAGGIIADSWQPDFWTIENCFTIGKATGSTWKPAAHKNVYETTKNKGTQVNIDDVKGEVAQTTLAGFDFGSVWSTTESYPMLQVFDHTVVENIVYWNTTNEPPKDLGDGNFEISTPEQLAYVINNGGGEGNTYTLTNDIYLNDLAEINWETGEASDGYTIKSWFTKKKAELFNGTLDGNGYVVYGLYYKDTDGQDPVEWDPNAIGLIPYMGKGVVKNIGVDYAYIYNNEQYATAAIIGCGHNKIEATIEQCFVGGNVKVSGKDAAGIIGGGVALGAVTIKNCYSLATLEATGYAGGIIADSWQPDLWKIENCFTVGKATGSTWKPATHKNVYETIKNKGNLVNVENIKGQAAKATLVGFDFNSTWMTTDGYPTLQVFDHSILGDDGPIWNGKIANKFESGKGSKEKPYIIKNGSQLAYAITNSNKDTYYQLSNNIYLNDVTDKAWFKKDGNNVWMTDSAFKGHLNGNGFIVYGIWYPENNAEGNVGLVPKLAGGSIEKIGVRYAYINGQTAGGIVGATSGTELKVINQCFVDETVIVKGNTSGGILGYAGDISNDKNVSLFIKNCYSKATLFGTKGDNINAIIGNSWKTPYQIENCYSVGNAPYKVAHSGNYTSASWNYEEATGGALRPNESFEKYLKNIYTDSGKTGQGMVWTLLESGKMKGAGAKQSMDKLDFNNVFEVVADGTPKLKVFKDYSGADNSGYLDSITFAGGEGTKVNPYKIEHAAQLKYLIESKNTENKYYELVADININDVSNKNWMNNNPVAWTQYNDKSIAFAGYIEGNGHIISGLYLSEKPLSGVTWFSGSVTGLFPAITTSATVRNIHIRDSYMSGVGYVGAITGFVVNDDDNAFAQIIGCSADETVTLKGQAVGGLVGGGPRGLELVYSYSTASISNPKEYSEQLGGLVGDMWSGEHKAYQVYSVGHKNYRDNKYAPFMTDGVYGTVAQNGTIVLTKAQMTGVSALEEMKRLDFKYWYIANGKTPQLKVIPADVGITSDGVIGEVWSGKIATKYAGGNGTESNPYIINTPEQLALLVSSENSTSDTYYLLTADIKLNNTSYDGWQNDARQWFARSGFANFVFRGHFDGNGHIVSGLYYNTVKNGPCALFPSLGPNSSIKRLGVSNSFIVNKGTEDEHSYAGAIVANMELWDQKNKDLKVPKISECFSDISVYVEGTFAGGIVCGAGRPVILENCYSIAELNAISFKGALVGNSWTDGVTISNSFGATKDRDRIGDGIGFNGDRSNCKNVYVDGPHGGTVGVKTLGLKEMQSDLAKEKMKNLDFSSVWVAVNGGTPVLACFKDGYLYTSNREAAKVEISFASLGGSKCDSIFGYAGYTKIDISKLPVPERNGYKFIAWHFYDDCTLKFDLEYFPANDLILYAEWEKLGFSVDFETYEDSKYDTNDFAEIFKPGIAGYNPKYLHGGYKSMYCYGDANNNGKFLLSYENTFEVGKEYEVSVWIASKDDIDSGFIEILHAINPQWDSDIILSEKVVDIKGLKSQSWTEYKFTFTAQSPYLVINTPKNMELWFDDISVEPTGKTGEIINAQTSPEALFNYGFIVIIAIIIGAGVILGATSVVLLVIIKKRKAGR